VIRSSDAKSGRCVLPRGEVEGAVVASFEAFDGTYARDKSNVYFDGRPIPDADAASFELLDRPGFFKDRHRVYQLDRPISEDPAHFPITRR
jgi:DKNYY family